MGMNGKTATLVSRLEGIKSSYGEQTFRSAIKQLNRSRLTIKDREPRKKFSWPLYRKLYQRQKGECPLCGEVMPLIKSQVVMDHKDPNRKDFNAESNLQVVHPDCNRRKAAKSIYKQSKETNRTFAELIK
jgi:5-methylcytosine-specific restriction endonuclease McrA